MIVLGALATLAATDTLLPSPAGARVNPLSIISRQIHKPNMLIVLDTSGSLTGVPGGNFDTSTEVGVDCDDGVNCRGGTANGTCGASAKTCSSDNQCRSSSCKNDGQDCVVDADCQPTAGTCNSQTCDSRGRNCQYASCFSTPDCPALDSGRCASTNSTCSSSRPCTSMPRCQYGSATCSLGQNCAAYGHCLGANNQPGSQECSVSSQCPLKSQGTCTFGGQSCTSVSSCPVKLCPDRATVCTSDADCGICSKGTSNLGTYCHSASNCSSSKAKCNAAAGSCSVNNNRCDIPSYTCQIEQVTNPCRETNACVGDVNSCNPGPTNSCVAGNLSDSCAFTSSGTGAIGMCRLTLLKCQSNSDCRTSGDSCGPATSRFVIAKRVLADMVANNAAIVNFGLMTFYQSLYFPYYSQTTTGTQSQSVYFTHGQLNGRGCFSQDAGPSQTCVIDGVTYSLAATNNSRYTIRGSGGDDVETNWCGFFCNVPSQGTGNYRGSTYTYTIKTGTVSTTPTVRSTYTGKQITVSGVDYRYYDSNPSYYNGGKAPPIEVPVCGSTCGTKCGARWDTQLSPFLDPTGDADKAKAMVLAVSDRMASASYGGLISYGGTPTGCALRNDIAANKNASAYDYMAEVKQLDTLACRDNFVLLVTDGEANGPGDSNCSSNACASSNPRAAGCTCRAVLSAYDLRQNLGVKTFVIGFSGDVAAGNGRLINDNIAKAGGTDRGDDAQAPYAFAATSEAELITAVQDAVYEAVKGSYATSPPTMSAGIQNVTGVTSGAYALDSRADFPSWKGHLLAYDTSVTPPTLVWDAAARMASADWKSRRIYTSDASNRLVQLAVDGSGNVTNQSALYSLGLGGNATEAGLIARWLMGDPAQGNPAIMGAIVNATPIDVGSPGDSSAPGGHAFYERYKNRPHLTYVGADDGMLHAFWSQDQAVNGSSVAGGGEAFAYLPPEMLPVVTRLYAQGGQLPDPNAHIFGIANSAKVKNICVSACDNPDLAAWKTVLVVGDGYGGNEVFALDITDPTASQPFSVMWSTASNSSRSTFDAGLGLTISVPGFYYNKTTARDDYRLIFGSGYRTNMTSGGLGQGLSLFSTSAVTGNVAVRAQVSPPGGSCGQEYTMLTDVATAKDYYRNTTTGADEQGKMVAGYAGDTWGNLWRFDGGTTPRLVTSLGCDHPLHFAPTVVQLDRDDPSNHSREIYLVQVTNSGIDDATQGFAPSQMVFMRETFDGDGNVLEDSSFGTNGKITLSVGEAPRMCAITDSTGTDCLLDMPLTARPMGTPLAVLKKDGSGFLALSTWYVPAGSGCGKGTTYMQIHQYTAGQTILKQALKVGDEPVSSPIVVGGKIMVMSSNGPVVINGSVIQNFVVGTSSPSTPGTSAEPFKILGWTEL